MTRYTSIVCRGKDEGVSTSVRVAFALLQNIVVVNLDT